MPRLMKYRSLSQEDFITTEFVHAGTIVSGPNQEIDVFRAVDAEDGSPMDDIEIRVILRNTGGLMIYDGISLTNRRGGPVILTGEKGHAVSDELTEVALYEAIEYTEKAEDYQYGRSPAGRGLWPGTFIEARHPKHRDPSPT